MGIQRPQTGPESHQRRRVTASLWLAGFLLAVLAPLPLFPQPENEKKTTGWVCGAVLDEAGAIVADAELLLFPDTEPNATEPEPLARTTSDVHGTFCLRGLAPGFYRLRAQKSPWPPQTPRRVEVRAGLVNRLNPMELELEPGEPHISYEESFDSMPPGQARAVIERLLMKGDAESIRELARRLLPKRSVRIDLGRLMARLDVKPLMDELLRQLDRGYLPPIKTARYVYVIGELADPRNESVVAQLLLEKLRDPRPLPLALAGSFGDPDKAVYVSDVAMHALVRLAGKDFKWKYGKPPVQNHTAISNARVWWRREYAEKKDSKIGVR